MASSHPVFTEASYGGVMTQETPPGWYPDPGQTDDAPATERWWDGKAWTDQTRTAGPAGEWGPPEQEPAGAYTEYPDYPEHPEYLEGYSGYPDYPAQAPSGGIHLRTGTAVALAALVLACIGAGVYALSDGNSGSNNTANTQQTPGMQGGQGGQGGPGGGQGGPFGGSGGWGGGGGFPTPEESESEEPKIDSGRVTDSVSGISLPIPDDWYGQEISVGAQITSDDSYDCPGDSSKSCTKGGAYSAPASSLGTSGDTAEEVAKADIEANAEDSYGGTAYGEITSHKVLASKSVTVAGEKGYLVRWEAKTSKGSDGYVQSLAFPSPSDNDQIVVVRFGVDVGEKQSVLDEITEGIKVSEDSDGDGGSGQDV